MKAPILLLAGALALSSHARASSEQAWNDLNKAMLADCLKASQLKGTVAIGTSALFDDKVGFSAQLMQGRYPQKHMKNRAGTELCLYDRKNRQAHVTEWDGIGKAATR
ncbi:hypothetical protein KDX38_10105 [Pseudomonas sp. CDFA 602]|uniref:hypothetical protein n=1 Tax=Pseudomonas californiensis TaxID=2829823 RepID=UPI001E568014|nr:hypothetical protein [Pseudomonas californiensis]MCD5993925.1 hypothetical protein [Pseudomonas californiensis]MCD5999572.1 hypothetical protein [Pseudomonas californiensis]